MISHDWSNGQRPTTCIGGIIMTNLTKGIGWDLVCILRNAGCTYTSHYGYIEVYNQYACGCTSLMGCDTLT
jgi:hypothetical protein